MADINVERKGPSIWPWIIGLLVLALLIWALAELLGDDDDIVEAPVPAVVEPTAVAPPPPVAPVAAGCPVISAPTTFMGQMVDCGPVRVTEVVSDRGFWVEDAGQRIFVLLDEGTQQNPNPNVGDVQGQMAEKPDINAGDMVQLTQATVRDASGMAAVNGPVDAQAQQIIQSQPQFLHVMGRNVMKM